MGLNFRTRSISYKSNLDTMIGACCTVSGCYETTAADCNSDSTSSFSHNLSCEEVNCDLGACCIDGHCEMTTIVGCYSRGGFYAGKEFDCSSFDCTKLPSTEPVQACCFGDHETSIGFCKDLRPSVCLDTGGTPRGPDSTCAVITAAGGCGITGATSHGKCCVGGECKSADNVVGSPYEFGYTAGDCSSLGGVYGGSGSTCGIDKDQVGGNTFDRSWPCSYPTGSCCFGPNPFAGYIYCGSSGHTYGSCLNPISQGGSGGSAFQVGVTCGFLNEFPLETISPSPTPVESGPAVFCSTPGTALGACCVPETTSVTGFLTLSSEILELIGESREILDGFTCYGTNAAGCAAIGGFFKSDEDGCDGISEEGCSCFGDEDSGDCPPDASQVVGSGAVHLIRPIGHPDSPDGINKRCFFDTDLQSHNYFVSNISEIENHRYLFNCEEAEPPCESGDQSWINFVSSYFDTDPNFINVGGISNACGVEASYNLQTCVYVLNENGTPEVLEVRFEPSFVTVSDYNANTNYYRYLWADDYYASNYPNTEVFFSTTIRTSETVGSILPEQCGIPQPSSGITESFVPCGCCYEDSCTGSVTGKCEFSGGEAYPGLYCGPDCGYLPCCSGSNNPVKVGIEKRISGLSYTEKNEISSCIDSFDFSSSEFDYTTAIDLLLHPSGPIHNIESLTLFESPLYSCEDCESSCSRNRGICCLQGDGVSRPVWNITKEECIKYRGKFAKCTGKPYSVAMEDGLNYQNESFDCSSLEGENSYIPTNLRGVGIPAYKISRMRR
ncbi:MAG: hypothetical protein CMM25_05015, partial [Rhodospirillaceae bacterium]|nr:hypothetical protein [Rhodospirillaceae bacterium]